MKSILKIMMGLFLVSFAASAQPTSRGERIAELLNTLLDRANYTETGLSAEERADRRRELRALEADMKNEFTNAEAAQKNAQAKAAAYKPSEKIFSIGGNLLLAAGGGTVAHTLSSYGSGTLTVVGAGVASAFFGAKSATDFVKAVRANRALTKSEETLANVNKAHESDWVAFTQKVNRKALGRTENSILDGKLLKDASPLERLAEMVDTGIVISEDRDALLSSRGCGKALALKAQRRKIDIIDEG